MINNRGALSLQSGPLIDYFRSTEEQSKGGSQDVKTKAHLRGVQLATDRKVADFHSSFSEQGP